MLQTFDCWLSESHIVSTVLNGKMHMATKCEKEKKPTHVAGRDARKMFPYST